MWYVLIRLERAQRTKKGGMYKTAHKAVCKIIHVHATFILPWENNKCKCGVFKILRSRSTVTQIFGFVEVLLLFLLYKQEKMKALGCIQMAA